MVGRVLYSLPSILGDAAQSLGELDLVDDDKVRLIATAQLSTGRVVL